MFLLNLPFQGTLTLLALYTSLWWSDGATSTFAFWAKMQECEVAKVKMRRRKCEDRTAMCEDTIASSPSHSRLRNSALSYLRPKGDSAKVEVAPSVHHPSLTFISHRHWSISPVVSTRWLSESVVARPTQKNKSESRYHISLITCSNSYLTLNETELFTLLSTDRWVHHFTVVPRVLLSRMNSLLSIFLHK